MMFYDIAGFLGARELARKTMTLYELYCKLLGTNVPISENIILGMYSKTINLQYRPKYYQIKCLEINLPIISVFVNF
jgi:hypothetical protein